MMGNVNDNDNIDDILDETLNELVSSNVKCKEKKVTDPSVSKPTPTKSHTEIPDVNTLLQDIEESPDLQKMMEQLMEEFQKNGSIAEGENKSGKTESPLSPSSLPFSERLEKAAATKESPKADKPIDPLESFVDDLCNVPDEAEFQNLIDGMIQQLMSKDILYEPMKELSDKYPLWIDANRSTDPEIQKYEKQHLIVKEIVVAFDDSNMSDAEKATKITELMDAMQQLGQPPSSLLSQLAPGMDAPFLTEPSSQSPPQCSIM